MDRLDHFSSSLSRNCIFLGTKLLHHFAVGLLKLFDLSLVLLTDIQRVGSQGIPCAPHGFIYPGFNFRGR